jgi:hypothetical protein
MSSSRRWVLATLAAACSACLSVPGVAVAGTLDQQQTDNGVPQFIYSTQSWAQTFTAGLTGGLDQVDLSLHRAGDPTASLSVEIRDVSGGPPGGTVLASGSVSAGSVPTSQAFVPINFTSPASVVAGNRYSIVAYSSTAAPNEFAWGGSSTFDPYSGGDPYFTLSSPPSGSWSMPINRDFAFKTYVAPPVPSNAYTFRLQGKRLIVNVQAAGTVSVSDATAKPEGRGKRKLGLRGSRVSGVPPTITVPLRLTKSARAKLRRSGKVVVRALITFAPTGGSPNQEIAALKIRAHGRRRA